MTQFLHFLFWLSVLVIVVLFVAFEYSIHSGVGDAPSLPTLFFYFFTYKFIYYDLDKQSPAYSFSSYLADNVDYLILGCLMALVTAWLCTRFRKRAVAFDIQQCRIITLLFGSPCILVFFPTSLSYIWEGFSVVFKLVMVVLFLWGTVELSDFSRRYLEESAFTQLSERILRLLIPLLILSFVAFLGYALSI